MYFTLVHPSLTRRVHPLPHAGEGAEGRSPEAGEGQSP